MLSYCCVTRRLKVDLQDVAGKILTFAQKGSRGVCVLSANGCVSNVTIRQPGSSGGLLTYEVYIYICLRRLSRMMFLVFMYQLVPSLNGGFCSNIIGFYFLGCEV